MEVLIFTYSNLLKIILYYIVTIENKNKKIPISVGPTIFQQSTMHDSISSCIHHLTFVSLFLSLSRLVLISLFSSCAMFCPFNISSFKDLLAVLKS